ncbi:hypothetical protein [Sphingopyxis granuli]|uniref:hypothetical protein n=1 Tax=Sphingopyxis granuli TaxID=267128 RepID=UPI001BAF8D52|nr:hypothetical protein [Sphingopyxis granuli]QUM73347.1 hypothetical protein ICN83_05525 [Sphingopyxis granuli]
MALQPMFGGYSPQVEPQRTATALPTATPEDYGAGIGDALQRAGGVAGQISVEHHRLETQREYDRQATDAMVRWSQMKEAYGVAENEARANAIPGAVGFAKDMTALADKQGEEFLSGIGQEGLRQTYRQRFAEWRSERATSADAFERGQTAKLMADQMDVAADVMANSLRGKPLQDFVDTLSDIETMEVPKGIPQDAVQQWRRGAAQKATVNWLLGQEPEQRKAMLDSHAYDALLTPEQVEQLGNGADSDIRRKQIEADAAARAAKADAIEKIDDVRDRITGGYAVTDEEYAEATGLAEQYGLNNRLRDLHEGATAKRVNKEWQNATPAQIDARVKVLDTAIAKAGEKAPEAMVAERKALADLLSTRTAQVKSDPLAAGAAMGISVGPVDWADPKSVAARRQAADATARAMGVPAKYLTDEEATQLAANADTPAGQLAIARQLRQLGPAAAKAAAGQVLPGDSLFAYSMGLRPEVQQGIFRGKGLRKEYPVPAKNAQEIWRETTGNSLASMPAASREAAYLSAVELYRQAASTKGKDEFDPTLFRGAVREALGGNVNGRTGGVGEWNGAKFLLPPTLSQQQFDARLGSYKPTRAYRGDKSKIGGAELRQRFSPVMQPNGRYRFVSARGEYVVIEDGITPLELDVTKLTVPAAPARPSRAAAAAPKGPVYVAPPAPDVQGPRSAYEGL